MVKVHVTPIVFHNTHLSHLDTDCCSTKAAGPDSRLSESGSGCTGGPLDSPIKKPMIEEITTTYAYKDGILPTRFTRLLAPRRYKATYFVYMGVALV